MELVAFTCKFNAPVPKINKNAGKFTGLLLQAPPFIMDFLPFMDYFSSEHRCYLNVAFCSFENVNLFCISKVVSSSYLYVTVIRINTSRQVLGEIL